MATDGATIYALEGASSEFYKYSIPANSWSAAADFPKTAAAGAALVYANGYIYALAGGNTVSFLRYDPSADSWSDAAVADHPRLRRHR